MLTAIKKQINIHFIKSNKNKKLVAFLFVHFELVLNLFRINNKLIGQKKIKFDFEKDLIGAEMNQTTQFGLILSYCSMSHKGHSY